MTNQEILANIVRNGNKILVVGGHFSKLGIEHPKIIVWDDEKDGSNTRQIPITVKAILYGRLISHKTSERLHNEIKRLGALKFPMLRDREVKSLLSEALKVEEVKPFSVQDVSFVPAKDNITMPPINTTTAPPKSGELKSFVIKNLTLGIDYSIRGAIKKEANRLFPLCAANGIKTTQGSIDQLVAKVLREMKENKGKSLSGSVSAPVAKQEQVNDFTELKKYVADAIAALKLVAEHLGKVEKEVEAARVAKDKLRKILEG